MDDLPVNVSVRNTKGVEFASYKWPTSESRKCSDGGVVPTCEITSKGNPYSHHLCFTVSIRTNKLRHHQKRLTKEQEETNNLIKSLHDDGMGYRKISHYLNERGINTHKGNRWTNTQVFSVLKRYRERQERLAFIEKEYEPVWGKMELKLLRCVVKSRLK